MRVRIIKPGFLSTLEDVGRRGFQCEGVPVSGAMDADALRSGNILVGNNEVACGIEFTLHGSELELVDDSLIAITGGGARGLINDQEFPFGKAIHVARGSTIKLVVSDRGCRSYLAVGGGFQAIKI